MAQVAVIGNTSWGTTLAIILARKGLGVNLWARTEEEAQAMRAAQGNPRRVPGVPFPQGIAVTSSLEEALEGVRLVILAVPSQSMRDNIKAVRPYLGPDMLLMSAAKGLEVGTALRMSEVIGEEVPPHSRRNVCVLSGPNLSREIVMGLPSASVVAAESDGVADEVRDLMTTGNLRVYSSTDLVGVELGGALKNIVALGAGIGDGWGSGDNAKAAFMARGLAEITRLGVTAGADPLTFLGLAGLGDLVATCSSRLSRNRYVGEELAKGRLLKEILEGMTGTAEGVPTTKAALVLAKRLGVEMPITQQMYQVLYEGYDPRKAIVELMAREPKRELDGIR